MPRQQLHKLALGQVPKSQSRKVLSSNSGDQIKKMKRRIDLAYRSRVNGLKT